MDLINKKEFSKALNLKSLNVVPTSKLFIQLLGVKKFNKFYIENYNKCSTDFITALVDRFNIQYEISAEDIERIPLTDSFIAVSNHPFAGIDGMLLLKIFSEKRPDFRLLADFFLQKISPLHDKVFPFNPFKNQKSGTSNFSAFKYLYSYLSQGNSIGMFPSPTASMIVSDDKILLDQEWDYAVLKFIKKAQVKVLPVYFEGDNNKLSKIINKIFPNFDFSVLQTGYFNKPNKIIRIRIGNPISLADQNQFTNISQYGRYIRLRTNFLGTSIEIKKFFHKEKSAGTKEEIVLPIPSKIIEDEVNKLCAENNLLFRTSSYDVICAHADQMPNILNEIGRLREITFRAVGEGTNRSIDLDEYDLYFQHLFIWDWENKKIVGSYRVGKGKDIISIYGKKGFYINTLFRLDDKLLPILKESIELGRSFVTEEYQLKPISLFLLWKGILYFLLKNHKYRYLIGPVSISNQYSKISQKLITDFVKSNYYNSQLAKYVKPRKKFHYEINDVDKKFIFETTSNDINKLDKFIKDIEPSSIKIPVLFKKYLKLNGKIIGFNIDPKFNNTLDGLLILDLFDVPNNTINAFGKEINDAEILERFNNKDIETFHDISKLLKKKKNSLLNKK